MFFNESLPLIFPLLYNLYVVSVLVRLALLKDQPDLVQLIKLAIEKSIQEWLNPVNDRAIKIALTTCEQIVKKDFSLDHDESRMRQAAHSMVRNLTAGMAMITCRDHLLLSIKSHLKNFIMSLGRNMGNAPSNDVEMTVSVIAHDNVELACAFIQKKAIEKAIVEIDKKLKEEFELRLRARKEGRRYCDAVALTYQAERMPDPIRLKVGGITASQSAVYDEFARHIPGFKVLSNEELASLAPKQSPGAGAGGASEAISQQHQQQMQQPSQQTTAVVGQAAAAATANPNTVSDECVAILTEVRFDVVGESY